MLNGLPRWEMNTRLWKDELIPFYLLLPCARSSVLGSRCEAALWPETHSSGHTHEVHRLKRAAACCHYVPRHLWQAPHTFRLGPHPGVPYVESPVLRTGSPRFRSAARVVITTELPIRFRGRKSGMWSSVGRHSAELYSAYSLSRLYFRESWSRHQTVNKVVAPARLAGFTRPTRRVMAPSTRTRVSAASRLGPPPNRTPPRCVLETYADTLHPSSAAKRPTTP